VEGRDGGLLAPMFVYLYMYMHSWVGTLQENTLPSGEGVCLEGCCLQLPSCTMRQQCKDGCSLCGMSSGGWFAESGSWTSELTATTGRLTFEKTIEHHCW